MGYVYSENKKIYCKDTDEHCTGKNYLSSRHWKKKRKEAYEFYKGQCQKCKTVIPIEQSNIHHRTYKRIGNEILTDLVLYCKSCHSSIHSEKKKFNEVKKTLSFYTKQLTEEEKKKVIQFIKTNFLGEYFSEYNGECITRKATEEERKKYSIKN